MSDQTNYPHMWLTSLRADTVPALVTVPSSVIILICRAADQTPAHFPNVTKFWKWMQQVANVDPDDADVYSEQCWGHYYDFYVEQTSKVPPRTSTETKKVRNRLRRRASRLGLPMIPEMDAD